MFGWLRKQETRIFYLVEVRTWNDGTLFQTCRNREGFTKQFMATKRLRVVRKTKDEISFDSGHGLIGIRQFVFKEFEAAQTQFETLKKRVVQADFEPAAEVSLIQVEARSADSARVMPPQTYASKSAIWLDVCQPAIS